MAARLIPMRYSATAFWVEIDGTADAASIYQDAETGEWLLTADAARDTLPAPFRRWTYEFAALAELCAFLRAPIPAAQDLRDAA